MCPSIAFDTSMNASECRKTSGSPATCQRALNCANVGFYFRDRVFARTGAASFLANHVFDVAASLSHVGRAVQSRHIWRDAQSSLRAGGSSAARQLKPHSAPMAAPFSATERFINSTRKTSANEMTPVTQKTSK